VSAASVSEMRNELAAASRSIIHRAWFILAVVLLISPRMVPAAEHVVPPRLDRGKLADLSDCYAISARRAGAEGEIRIMLTVGTDGYVSEYELPAGIERWQEVTADCVVPRLRYVPATRDGVPFAATISFSLAFALEGSDPLTLAKLTASEGEIEEALRSCYPPDRKETATSEYRVTVNVRGWPSQVMLVKSSGDKKLDKAGACVLKKVRYEPAKRGERPVMSTLLVPLTVRPPRLN
jgi:hypothetical protein